MFVLRTSMKKAAPAARAFHASAKQNAKVLVALYEDPKSGYPPKYARDSIPEITEYADGGLRKVVEGKVQTGPTPNGRDFNAGDLLGCVSGELGLRKYLEANGHELVVTADKDGDGCEFEKHLADANIVISQPFWPAYMTAERIAMAPNLEMCLTAGIGSDHIDLEEANRRKISVTEVTFCNSISVAEHVCMQMLALVRNYIPSYKIICDGGWNIADAVERSYDIEGMHIGTVAAGRIGLAVLKRMAPFDVHLHYCDRHRLPAEIEEQFNLTYHESPEDMVPHMDVVTINCPLHPETEHLFDANMISKMKRGAYIVNTARGKICNRDDIVSALESGHLAGYAGDVWFPQPPPKNHPWRTAPNHAMTPHISGTSLSAQTRYCDGVREILECHFEGRPQRSEYLICEGGGLAGTGAHSYSDGNATGGSDEAAGVKVNV